MSGDVAQFGDSSIGTALGLTNSQLPTGLGNELRVNLARKLREILLFKLSVSEQHVPCASGDGRCCRFIVNPPEPWPSKSPFLSLGKEFKISFSIGDDTLGKLDLTFSIKTENTLSRVSHDKRCPTECSDDSLDVDVTVRFSIELKVKGSVKLIRKQAGGGSLISPPNPIIDFGPNIGQQTGSQGYVFSDVSFDFTIALPPLDITWSYRFACGKPVARLSEIGLLGDSSGTTLGAPPSESSTELAGGGDCTFSPSVEFLVTRGPEGGQVVYAIVPTLNGTPLTPHIGNFTLNSNGTGHGRVALSTIVVPGACETGFSFFCDIKITVFDVINRDIDRDAYHMGSSFEKCEGDDVLLQHGSRMQYTDLEVYLAIKDRKCQ